MKKIYSILLTFSILLVSNQSFSQVYEILFNEQTASGWFGGDDRPGSQRNVANAQSVTIEQPINLESFSVYFTSSFDFVQNPTGTGHEVTIRLHIRDSVGSVLHTEDLVLADTFSGGWATWPAINFNIDSPGKYIFSYYLVGGYDSLQVSSGVSCDINAGYSGGERYVKYVANDSEALSWGDWSNHSWDTNFSLKGTLRTTGVKNEVSPTEFNLSQNYPNPFEQNTKISWQSPIASHQTVKVYDVAGNVVVTLVDEFKPAGNYEMDFNASEFPGGVYFYQLIAGNKIQVKKMMLRK